MWSKDLDGSGSGSEQEQRASDGGGDPAESAASPQSGNIGRSRNGAAPAEDPEQAARAKARQTAQRHAPYIVRLRLRFAAALFTPQRRPATAGGPGSAHGAADPTTAAADPTAAPEVTLAALHGRPDQQTQDDWMCDAMMSLLEGLQRQGAAVLRGSQSGGQHYLLS